MSAKKTIHVYGTPFISPTSPKISSSHLSPLSFPLFSPPFTTLSARWLENVRLRVKESTYVKYYNITKNHILPKLGTYTADQLTTETVEQFVQEKLVHGRCNGTGGLSEKTVKDILTVLQETCRYAGHWGIEIPCHFDRIRIRKKGPEIRVLSRERQQDLVTFLLKDESLTKLGILMSLYMGLRLGEICALQRRSILFHEGILCVRYTMQRIQDFPQSGLSDDKRKTKIIITEPKSGSSIRDIPIPAFLLERLWPLQSLPEDAFLLTGSVRRFIEPRTLENILKKYLRECGLEDVTYHMLRHTFATRCIEGGFDVKALSEILGHASVNVTLNRYVHSSIDQKRKYMEQLSLL
ncbi:MAG: site-specific integrase [Lachnospiraceae bacterium]|nr:site-specific integrase [Lachnospiraceae bacterium]